MIGSHKIESRSRADRVEERNYIRFYVEKIDVFGSGRPLFRDRGTIGQACDPHHFSRRTQGAVKGLADLEDPHPLLLPCDVRRRGGKQSGPDRATHDRHFGGNRVAQYELGRRSRYAGIEVLVNETVSNDFLVVTCDERCCQRLGINECLRRGCQRCFRDRRDLGYLVITENAGDFLDQGILDIDVETKAGNLHAPTLVVVGRGETQVVQDLTHATGVNVGTEPATVWFL